MSEATESPAKLSTQAALLIERNEALHARFDELYKKKRMRHDDVLNLLSKEFFITPRTIRGVLKTALPQQLAPAAAAPATEAAPAAQF
jgi:hypothetical protein